MHLKIKLYEYLFRYLQGLAALIADMTMEGGPANGEFRIMNMWAIQEVVLFNDTKKQKQEEVKKHDNKESGHFEELFLEALAKTV